MFATNLSSALPTLFRVTARGVPSHAHDVQWIVTIWRLLFTVSAFSTIHFPDGQAVDDASEAIETVVDDVPGGALPVAKPGKGFGRAIKVAFDKTVKRPGQCFSAEHWIVHVSDAPDAPSTSATAPDHPSDAPELWSPSPPMVLIPGLRVVRVRAALPPFQAGPTPASMLRPPACA